MESVNAVLELMSSSRPDTVAYTFRSAGGTIGESITYRDLDRRARAYAAYVTSITTPADRVLLLYPAGIDYVVAFFGCLYAGVVAVPSYPPTGVRPIAAIERSIALARDAGARVALTTEAVAAKWDAGRAGHTAPCHPVPRDLDDARGLAVFPAAGDELAMLQYTSGSTGSPKGVMITHANLLSNMAVMAQGLETREGTTFVSWLPLYHDMGLVAGVLLPLLVGGTQHLMSPTTFLRRPFAWLEAISSERASITVAPNFAYELCLRRITAADADRLDLSSWSVAAMGAEPVRAETIRRFSHAFARCGFRAEATYPSYGLAEATCAVTGGAITAEPVVLRVDREALQSHEVKLAEADGDGLEVVGCGHPYLDHSVTIVTEEGARCEPGEVGEIWITGSSVSRGYWGRPEASQRVFEARLPPDERAWLRTGDLGFLREGELFVVGRSKDVIIIRGRNHAPEDLELTVDECSDLVEPGGVVAFGVDEDGEERLVLVVALVRGVTADAKLGELIMRRIAEVHGVEVHDILFVRGREIPRTSSGKVQRRACRTSYRRRELTGKGRWREPPDLQAE
jgi:acyl-CoA synthetase (AMP-forming)/AMP-acid ligase II